MNDRPWPKQYDKGVPTHIEVPLVPVFHFLEEAARTSPSAPCTIFKGATISFKEMNELTDRMAAALADLGLQPGERVGILMPNIPQFVIAFFGILKAGGVVVAINPLFTTREIQTMAQDAGIKIAIAASPVYASLKQAQAQTQIQTIILTNPNDYLPPVLSLLYSWSERRKDSKRALLEPDDLWFKDLLNLYEPSDRPVLKIGPEDVAIFQYSGGTTGTPKGAIALHRNLVANALQFRGWLVGTQDGKETILVAIPLYHVYGMVLGMLLGLHSRARMVLIPNPRDLKELLSSIQKYKVSIFPGVPTLYNAINNHPDVKAGKYNLSTIVACISGSAPLLSETKTRFEALTGGRLMEGYGLSEAPTATHCNPMLGENRPGSIGLPLPDVDCRIVSLQDGITRLPPGEAGEMIVRSPQVMQGYHNLPEETSLALRDGWLYTGDIARMDEEGYFYIVDRKKELIKPGGFEVWPREVEEILAAHPKVLEVGVAGVPDAYRGETVKAWVVLKPGKTATEEELRLFCRESLAPYKVPTQIEFREHLPRTNVGKILRRELVRQHNEQQHHNTLTKE